MVIVPMTRPRITSLYYCCYVHRSAATSGDQLRPVFIDARSRLRLFFRGTHNVRDELQLSHFVG